MQSLPSSEHVSILDIKTELTKNGLLSHAKYLDTFHSYLDYRDYFCHQKLLSTCYDNIDDVVDRVMVHPSNGEAWEHFNNLLPQ